MNSQTELENIAKSFGLEPKAGKQTRFLNTEEIIEGIKQNKNTADVLAILIVASRQLDKICCE
jgi:hypothetical protein